MQAEVFNLNAFFMAHPVLKFILCMSAGYFGMFTHILKQNIAGQTMQDIKNYVKKNPKHIIIALMVVPFAVLLAYSLGEGIVASWGMGYGYESFMNKYSGYTPMSKITNKAD